jgi:hypothetical protein
MNAKGKITVLFLHDTLAQDDMSYGRKDEEQDV